jgi:predicted regulator of amino acid metabolism with ACT domain
MVEDKDVKTKSKRRLRTMAAEKFTVDGSQVVEKIKELIHQGNIRRVRLIHKGRPLIDIPLTVGVGVATVTALAAPVLAALGAIAALVTECTIEVERIGDTPEEKDKKQ